MAEIKRSSNSGSRVKRNTESTKGKISLPQNGVIQEEMLEPSVQNKLNPEQLQDFTTISSIGSLNQQFAGHLLTNDSFDSTPEGLWLLDDLTDDSGNSNTLTNVNSTPFTATDIMGNVNSAAAFVAASSQCLYANNTNFDDTGSFTCGCWLKADLPGSAIYTVASKYDVATAANRSWQLYLDNSSTLKQIVFQVQYDTSNNVLCGADHALAKMSDNARHLLIAVYDQTNTELRLYLDGELIGKKSDANLSARNNSATPKFTIGARDGDDAGNRDNFFDGEIGNSFYAKFAMTQKEVDLIYATKYTLTTDHTSNTEYVVRAFVEREGDSDFAVNYNFPEIARKSFLLFRRGGVGSSLKATDDLKIVIGR